MRVFNCVYVVYIYARVLTTHSNIHLYNRRDPIIQNIYAQHRACVCAFSRKAFKKHFLTVFVFPSKPICKQASCCVSVHESLSDKYGSKEIQLRIYTKMRFVLSPYRLECSRLFFSKRKKYDKRNDLRWIGLRRLPHFSLLFMHKLLSVLKWRITLMLRQW